MKSAVSASTAIDARTVFLLILLWLVGLYLRIPVLAAPPLAGRIAADFGLGSTGTGALTMVPVIMLALGAVPAALLIGRIGVRGSIILGMTVMAVASAARGWASGAALLFGMSAAMGLGIVLFQTALPSAVKGWLPHRAALGSTVYLNGMMVGELSGAGLTLPVLLPLAGGDWSIVLLLWSLPVAGIVLLLLVPKVRDEAVDGPQVWTPDWRSAEMWSLGLWLAASIAAFFVVNAYMAVTLENRGERGSLPALLLAYNVTPLIASVLMVFVGNRWIGGKLPIAVTGALAFVGLAAFAFLSGVPAGAGAVVTGLAATVQLILVLSLPPVIASGAGVARLMAGITVVGYAIAFVLPLAGGALADASERPFMIYVPTLLFAAGLLASQRWAGDH